MKGIAMNCPKCSKSLVGMQDKRFAYCPNKELVVKFGPPYDRKFKIEKAADSGCGSVFTMPLSEYDELHEMDMRYRPWKNRN
jgi:hypothetical protein